MTLPTIGRSRTVRSALNCLISARLRLASTAVGLSSSWRSAGVILVMDSARIVGVTSSCRDGPVSGRYRMEGSLLKASPTKLASLHVVWILLLVRSTLVDTFMHPEVKEYCQFQSFNASCKPGEVVIIESAMYGRMRTGKCVTRDYGHVGCERDVKEYLSSVCSGRQSCKFEVPDAALKAMRPCPKDFASYLAASYSCVSVQTGGITTCYTAGHLEVSAEPEGYLASLITSQSGKGSADCPWTIRAKPGQRLNITLMDFTGYRDADTNDVLHRKDKAHRPSSTFCHKYAVIKEQTTTRETVVCGADDRHRVVYISATNVVEVEIAKYSAPKKNVYFLLKYQAIGCPDYPTPKNGWMRRVGDVTHIGCNDTSTEWTLKCIGGAWVGAAYNCTPAPESAQNIWTLLSDDWSSPFGILIVSAMGILLGLIIGAALLAVVLIFVKKNKSTCLGPASDYMVTSQDGEDQQQNGGNYVIQNKRNSVTALMDQYEMSNIADSNYGATWRVHPSTVTPEEGATTRLMAPVVTCTASVTETGGSPCRAPDVTCVLRKSQKGPRDPHVYEAPFLGRDIVQLHIGPVRDG